MSKFICLKIQDRVLFADYKARKRGLDTNESFIYKIADVVFDEYGDVVYDSDNNLHLLAYENVGSVLFEDMVDQALKLAKDMKIPTNELNKDLDFQTHVYEQLGYFRK